MKINEFLDCNCDYDESERELAEAVGGVGFQNHNVVHHLILNTILKSYAQKESWDEVEYSPVKIDSERLGLLRLLVLK